VQDDYTSARRRRGPFLSEASAQGAGEFDLRRLVAWEAPRRTASDLYLTKAVATVLIGLSLLFGIYLLFDPRNSLAWRVGSSLLFLVGGTLVGLYAWFSGGRSTRPVVKITISDLGISWERENGTVSQAAWSSRGIRITLYDRSKLHTKLGDRDRRSAYSAHLPGGTRAPLTFEAFASIVSAAERHGLTVRKGKFPGSRASPQVSYVLITRASRSG
jgi:hypothetical protein